MGEQPWPEQNYLWDMAPQTMNPQLADVPPWQMPQQQLQQYQMGPDYGQPDYAQSAAVGAQPGEYAQWQQQQYGQADISFVAVQAPGSPHVSPLPMSRQPPAAQQSSAQIGDQPNLSTRAAIMAEGPSQVLDRELEEDPSRLPTFIKVRGLPAEHDPRIARKAPRIRRRPGSVCDCCN
eukprot:NODE_3280_length_808_cov_238.527224.p2 GENE.NODE_3280_length_808_cov_238.527224~~NODE_3280_length_808_cov_238.527224.p2  ORF type:complete len:178 (+),score=12.00 NODE_3280_length_808_cov_238.527224:3-536(+)